MSDFDTSPPSFSESHLAEIASTVFNIEGKIKLLESERDQNVLVAGDDGKSYILKIANAGGRRELIALQNAALQHIATVDPALGVPAATLSVSGNDIELVADPDGGGMLTARLLTFVPGKLFSSVPKALALLHSLGDFLGRLSCALQGFSHPAAHRADFLWNLDNAMAVHEYIEAIDVAADRDMIRAIFSRYHSQVQPRLPSMRVAVIHGDANDNNLVVDEDDVQSVVGVFDFGDMAYARQVNELAIAMAYALMGVADIAAASRALIGGYTLRFPLHENELEVLFDLIEMRLAMSLCISSHRARKFPDNDYLLVSRVPALALLRTLGAMNAEIKVCISRVSAGVPAVPQGAAIVEWLTRSTPAMAPVFERDLHTLPRTVVSFVEGAAGASHIDDAEKYSQWLNERLAATGSDYAIGLYAEDRNCYRGEQFIVAGSSRTRSTHLGMDIFIAANTPVLAPYAGHVYSVQDNDLPYDYGGTVILQHVAGDTGLSFYTLYGHLSKKTLSLFHEGDAVSAGDVIGYIGAPHENGGWAPHLHFQIMTTMLGLKGNFDGASEPDRFDIWSQICPHPNLILGFSPESFSPAVEETEALVARRGELLGPSLSTSYQKKLHVVRGRGAWLYDASGRAYLDCVNNICHVGHCHPHVVEAIARQAQLLNTNTRYLHNTILDYAERLAATMPDPLSLVYFVNSGSEANELALRLARHFTGRKEIITLDSAYHGNTGGLIDISPYKFSRRGGCGPGTSTYVAELPDPFRGRFKGYGDASARAYAESVAMRIDEIRSDGGAGPAAFIAESISGCGGQIMFPDTYFQHAFAHVRAAGGLCIVDEVQTGFGRVGDVMWAYELQNVVPDIVTLGKPIGNGHPLAAVVTTREIAARFANGMEYFNSFGGNPVSCAAGMAVLDVIEAEKLCENAQAIFHSLSEKLRVLKNKYPLIGDVRGRGLFLGIELVRVAQTLEPATIETERIINFLRNDGVLLSSDGPFHNVLKFKPPMVFGERELKFFVDKLENAFAHLK